MTQLMRQATSDSPLAILQQAVQQLQAQLQIEPLFDIAMQTLQAAYSYPLIWAALYDQQTHLLSGVAGICPDPEADIARLKLTVLAGTLFDQVLVTRHPLEVPNLQSESRADKWQALAQTFNIQGATLYPICYRDQVLGMLMMGSQRWGNAPRAEELLLRSTLMTLLGTHIYALRHQQQPQTGEQLPDALLSGLAKSTALDALEDRIGVMLQHLHQAFNPNHTSFYHFDPEQQRFYRQLTEQSRGKGRLGSARMPKIDVGVQDISHFCQALQAGQGVSISDLQSLTHSAAPTRLMHQLQVRSLLTAPVKFQEKLLGFLALESRAPRLWQEPEKQYLQGAAQILGLHLRIHTTAASPLQTTAPTAWLLPLMQTIGQPKAWNLALQKSLQEVCQRFQAQWGILCRYYPEAQQYMPYAQAVTSAKRHPLDGGLPALSEVDTQMLVRSTSAIGIRHLEDDLRFLTWRKALLSLKLQSLLVANLSPGQAPDWVMILGGNEPRLWTTAETDQVQRLAVDLAPLLSQHQQMMLGARRDQLTQMAQTGLRTLQAQPQTLPTQLLELLTQMFPTATPLLVLRSHTEPAPLLHRLLPEPSTIQLPDGYDDPLLQTLLIETATPYQLQAVAALSPTTRGWLDLPHLQHLWAIPLQQADQILGVVLLGSPQPQGWLAEPLEPGVHLVQGFAYLYHTQQQLQSLRQQNIDLEGLNWYKQRQLEFHCQTITTHYEHLYEVMSHVTPPLSRDKRDLGAFALLDSIQAIEALLQSDGWQLQTEATPIAVTTLLRRLLERIEPVTQSRRLWTKVHNQTQALTLQTAASKLELILLELLLSACYRSQPGQNLDLWCRLCNDQWLELSITDSGIINPQLLQDLQQSQSWEITVPTSLAQVPGRHLRICQQMTQRLGGNLEIRQLEDGRTLSRMTLPITSPTGN